jgi:SAM-dependent methyltransferase
MPNFTKRSQQKELLDEPNISFDAIKINMEELNVINRLTGGHATTIAGLKNFLPSINAKQLPIKIYEIGCGGGDNLRVIKNWCSRHGIIATYTGVDINAACVAFAKTRIRNEGINFICSDYKHVKFIQKPDIIFSSLFCHHFTNEALIDMMKWLQENTNLGFFINDLHRYPIAYYFIKWSTNFLSKSYLVKNDAPISVLRGFSKKDWQHLFTSSNITHYSIKWQWAFRWLVWVENKK